MDWAFLLIYFFVINPHLINLTNFINFRRLLLIHKMNRFQDFLTAFNSFFIFGNKFMMSFR